MKKLVLITAIIASSFTAGFAQLAANGYYGQPQGINTGYNSGYDHGPPAMSDMELSRAMSTIDRQRYESSKLTVAKQVAQENSLQARQVRKIMHLFSFESTRLSFAKFAYDFVIDAEQYQVVKGALNYGSSRADLDRFIASRHQSTTVVSSGNTGSMYYNGGVETVQVQPTPAYVGNVGYNHGASGGQGHAGHGHGQGDYDHHGHMGHSPNHAMFNHREFDRILCSVKAKCFDSDRLRVAKQAICSKMLTAAQVLTIMEVFSFESTRLKFAKFAYSKTCDRQNYYMVNDGFAFSSSIRDLERFIARC